MDIFPKNLSSILTLADIANFPNILNFQKKDIAHRVEPFLNDYTVTK
jgi:hypothetical protein